MLLLHRNEEIEQNRIGDEIKRVSGMQIRRRLRHPSYIDEALEMTTKALNEVLETMRPAAMHTNSLGLEECKFATDLLEVSCGELRA